MNTARILSEIADMEERLGRLKRIVEEDASPEAQAKVYATTEEYAERASVSTETVRKWLKQGMPCVRRGRAVRIPIAEADRWTPGETVAASAAHAAQRGTR